MIYDVILFVGMLWNKRGLKEAVLINATYPAFIVGASPSKKVVFIYFYESLLKTMKDAFLLIM